MVSSKSLFLLSVILCGCNGGDRQERTGAAGSARTTSGSTENGSGDVDGEDETADEPVDVTGAYLTAEFIPDLPDKNESEVSVGGHVEKDGVVVNLSGQTGTGKMINTTSNVVMMEFAVDPDATEYHYKFNVKKTDMGVSMISVDIVDASGKKTTLTRKMDDMTGTAITDLVANKVFEFNSLSDVPTGLTATSYCDAAGPMNAVKKTVDGLAVTIATMSPGETVALNKTDHCFHKVQNFMGSAEKSLLAPQEKISEYVGSGSANGGTVPCLFVFVENISAAAPSATKLYVLKDAKDGLDTNLRKTAADLHCP